MASAKLAVKKMGRRPQQAAKHRASPGRQSKGLRATPPPARALPLASGATALLREALGPRPYAVGARGPQDSHKALASQTLRMQPRPQTL